ncbi:hypothetical protein J3R30DRAFT_3714390 [Lentinula aciculospora]|uniref:Uncharacterized protein n=1 Tax=Lentinula aciculospora TaxID=153920 RepID=A0A9W8ZWV3_9AGAR|nr:hypothetical protein J3R30DRAFT_3714390 [Lentinula aciculospora]
MALKRSAESCSPSRTSKRRQILFPSVSNPVTPAKTVSSVYQFPSSSSTPYPLFPSDSPSNPFGRTRTLSASLPAKSSFGRHLPLRFQFFRHGTSRDREGVYRVVQIPLSYNFKHLRTLIAFLFGGQPMSSADEDDENTGHLFEIRKNVVMFANRYKPGTIRRSETSVRLSSARDPYRYKDEWDYGEDWREDDDEFEDEEDELSEDGQEQARWEAEEDYTLEHVWKPALNGEVPDDKAAIVYFHSSLSEFECPVQVQITLFKGPITSRVGSGNVPYVFQARGHVYLSPLDSDELDPEEDYAEDTQMNIDTDTWNEPKNGFAKFLIDSVGIAPPNFHQSRQSDVASTPSLIHDSSSPSRITDHFPSSPYPSSSPMRAAISKLSPLANSYPKYTPAPPPVQRKRVAYILKRIERSKHKKPPKPVTGSGKEDDSKRGTASHAVEKPTGPRGIDGRYLTREQAMAIIGADDNVAEV